MYSDKENINILTSLLAAHGVRHAVICPGSRNAPIAHNLCECPDIHCESVTDERSAAFVALGMSQALSTANTNEYRNVPVAVCVTSGTALLNTLPAVAEAYYQHIPLVIISADRPAAMIDQLQGQTLPQPGALGKFVKKAVNLPEPHDETEHWYCNRLVNEALIAMRQHGGGPVHINVPITEPLFNFNIPSLPSERIVKYIPCDKDINSLVTLAWDFFYASKPMIVIGQLPYSVISEENHELLRLRDSFVVLQEKLSDDFDSQCHFDEALSLINNDDSYKPDFVIYIGATFVSKKIKQYLQSFNPKRTVVASETGELTDVTMHATELVECSAKQLIEALWKVKGLCLDAPAPDFYARWKEILSQCKQHCDDFQPGITHISSPEGERCLTQMLAVKQFHKIVNLQDCFLQYGNSSAVRLGIMYSTHYIYVNRGVNGIEGSLSTAVGFNSVVDKPTYCVVGDLSFFYDQNALWNNLDKKGLRMLLLNNGCGGIFHQLPGLDKSPWRDGFVAASHGAKAKGICEETHIEYKEVWSPGELEEGMAWLTDEDSPQPKLLEVFTDPERDAEEMRRYAASAKPKQTKHTI